MAKVLEENKFELKSLKYVHFQTNIIGKCIEAHYSTTDGLNSITTILLQEWFGHWITNKDWYAIKQKKKARKSKLFY